MTLSGTFHKNRTTNDDGFTIDASWASDFFFFLDREEELVGCNRAVLDFLGYQTFEQLQSHSATLSQIFLDDKECLRADFGGWVSAVKSKLDPRAKIRDKNGRIHLYSMRTESADKDEEFSHVIILHDITVLEKAKRAERYFSELKHEFLTTVSHEFRTPMNGILGFTNLLGETPLDSGQREYLGLVESAAKSMMGNIENLIEIMQIESGVIHEVLDFYDPIETYERFSTHFIEQAKASNVQLFFMIDPRLPHLMLGDAEKVTRVLRNLIDNAIKFTAEGGRVLVEITFKEQAGEVARVEYAVTDTGEGIAKERLTTILRPFAAARENQIRGKTGFGVGLNLSHKLLSIMHSSLKVASEVNRGSRFAFDIKHRVNEASICTFETVPRVAVWVEDKTKVLHEKLLGNYLKNFGINAVWIGDLVDGRLNQTDVLIAFAAQPSQLDADVLRARYPDLKLVSVTQHDTACEYDEVAKYANALLALPLLPSNIYNTLHAVMNEPKADENVILPVELLPDKEHKRAKAATVNKILIAEDNPINLKLLQTVLENNGYEVDAVDDGKKAVDRYLEETYNLVLMDIDMPVMDGITATQLIKEIDQAENRDGAPVIALTAHTLSGEKERILKAGLDAHLSKPIDMPYLLKTLKRYLGDKPKEERRFSFLK